MKRCAARPKLPLPANGCGIHPQGWVPVETSVGARYWKRMSRKRVAFTPKGGCPLKPKTIAPKVRKKRTWHSPPRVGAR